MVPLANFKALDVPYSFFTIGSVYGVPIIVISDNGSQCAAKFFQNVCAMLGIRQVFASTYYPQSKGQVESFNKAVLERVGLYVSARQDDWD